MPERNVAIVIFYDDKENIIFQERGSASKAGEKYGSWGGQIESGETPEQAIKRELMEELDYAPKKIDFWCNDYYIISQEDKYKDWKINQAVFVSPITPELEKAQIHEGEGIVKMAIDEAIESNGFLVGGTNLLKKFKKELYNRQ